jgi:hypothetical protein
MWNPIERFDMTGERATELGYCRVSNRYRTVARIDRPDWVEFMAEQMMRAPADFIVRSGPHKGEVSDGWCDFYRRSYSHDQLVLTEAEFKKVPTSCGNAMGYVPKPHDGPGFCEACSMDENHAVYHTEANP